MLLILFGAIGVEREYRKQTIRRISAMKSALNTKGEIMIEDDEMDTGDWVIPPETEKMLRERIDVLEDCLLNVIGGQQDPNIKAEDLPTLVCGHLIKTDVRIAEMETALEKANELFTAVDLYDSLTNEIAGEDGPEWQRVDRAMTSYQEARLKV